MKSKKKIETIILIFLGIIFGLSVQFNNNLNTTGDNTNNISLDSVNLKVSKVSSKIHIDNNWSAAKAVGICNGSGTESNPYVIEDLIIDGGGVGSCILVENSIDYFIILNCRTRNAENISTEAEIKFYNVSNGHIFNNNFYNSSVGIFLDSSNNTVLIGNSIDNPHLTGIRVVNCHDILAYYNNFRGTLYDAFFQDSTYRFYSEKKIYYIYNNIQIANYIGNYWSAYMDSDNDDDGIGDNYHTYYNGGEHDIDHYPLIEPIENYRLLGFASKNIIPGYDLFLIFGIISMVSIFIIKKIKK
ncbi:MAG: NosD domain-containing protein [Promethearchaeota archaeon]